MIKKILTIGGIGFALVACNENKKIKKKVNPETGKTEIVEVKNLAPVKKAISDSAGVYTQKFILEKGKTYSFSSTQKVVQEIKISTGQSDKRTEEVFDDRNIVVENFENGVYDLTLNFLSKKMTSFFNGETITVDTKKPAPKDEGLKNTWTINSVLAGSKFSVKMKENGEVLSISGFDEVYKKMEKTMTPIIKDKKHRADFMQNFKIGFNENLLKGEFAKSINILPKKGVKIGESWTITENLDPSGKIKSTLTYTLDKVENGVAEISVKGSVPKKSDKNTQEGLTRTVSIEATQNGILRVDESTGWISNSKINIKTTNKESVTDGKVTQSATSTSDNTVTIN